MKVRFLSASLYNLRWAASAAIYRAKLIGKVVLGGHLFVFVGKHCTRIKEAVPKGEIGTIWQSLNFGEFLGFS